MTPTWPGLDRLVQSSKLFLSASVCQALHREPVAPHLITQEAAWYVQGSNCRQYRGYEQVPSDKVGAEAVDISRGHINEGLNG